MFDPRIIEVLKKNTRGHTDLLGEPTMLRGGLRVRKHPLPSMDFEPDTLAVGNDLENSMPQRMIGGKGFRSHSTEIQNGIELSRGGSMKSIGKSISRGLKKTAKVLAPVAKEIYKEVKPIASKYARDQLVKFLAKDALPVAEEVAPLMLAAGRPKRVQSARMQSRAALVRKIMKDQGCSLPEASRYIKENDMEY
jgi:hypothetical protein